MEFRENEAIYLQIADFVSTNVLLRKWKPEEKIPSVRDLAIELQVNLNTVMHAYEYLENQGIIFNKRGIGFFIGVKGFDKVMAIKKEKFLKQDLPQLFSNMFLLDIPAADIVSRYEQFRDKTGKSKPKKL